MALQSEEPRSRLGQLDLQLKSDALVESRLAVAVLMTFLDLLSGDRSQLSGEQAGY